LEPLVEQVGVLTQHILRYDRLIEERWQQYPGSLISMDHCKTRSSDCADASVFETAIKMAALHGTNLKLQPGTLPDRLRMEARAQWPWTKRPSKSA
jgi:hypothetical protein